MMKILIAGATGFIGSSLVPFLKQAGYDVHKLVRKETNLAHDEISWEPSKGLLNATDLEGFDAIINFAGENISSGRWTEKKKKSILESRVKATQTLAKTIRKMKGAPKVFINASATGYYGSRGETWLNEDSPNGTGFLAHVCEEWEKAAKPIDVKNVRLVFSRFGIILSPNGGALAKMLLPFKLGLGGVIGTGKQYMSWITLDDVLGAIHHILNEESLTGPINLVAPQPVTNAEFTKTLGRVLSRPTFFNLPASLVRFIFGEMADEMLLSSQRATCTKLTDSGYQFCLPNLENSLNRILKN